MEITGKISAMLDKRTGTKKDGTTWAAQDIVIEYQNGQYMNHMVFSVFGADKLQMYSKLLTLGNEIKVSFDIDAHEYNGKWYTSIKAWKMEEVNAVSSTGQPAANVQPNMVAPSAVPPPPAAAIPAPQTSANGDALPF